MNLPVLILLLSVLDHSVSATPSLDGLRPVERGLGEVHFLNEQGESVYWMDGLNVFHSRDAKLKQEAYNAWADGLPSHRGVEFFRDASALGGWSDWDMDMVKLHLPRVVRADGAIDLQTLALPLYRASHALLPAMDSLVVDCRSLRNSGTTIDCGPFTHLSFYRDPKVEAPPSDSTLLWERRRLIIEALDKCRELWGKIWRAGFKSPAGRELQSREPWDEGYDYWMREYLTRPLYLKRDLADEVFAETEALEAAILARALALEELTKLSRTILARKEQERETNNAFQQLEDLQRTTR